MRFGVPKKHRKEKGRGILLGKFYGFVGLKTLNKSEEGDQEQWKKTHSKQIGPDTEKQKKEGGVKALKAPGGGGQSVKDIKLPTMGHVVQKSGRRVRKRKEEGKISKTPPQTESQSAIILGKKRTKKASDGQQQNRAPPELLLQKLVRAET